MNEEEFLKEILEKYSNDLSSGYSEITKNIYNIEQKGFSSLEDKDTYNNYKAAKRMLTEFIVIDYMKKEGYRPAPNCIVWEKVKE